MTTPAPPLLELVGVAGSGKTTLLKELKRRDPRLFTELTVNSLDRLTLLVRHTLRFLPALLRHAHRGRWLTWEELRAMGYLEGWRRVVQGHRGTPLVFDHGPIFRLVQLRELGPPLVVSPGFVAWWQSQRRAWSRVIDLVVWLDAPDSVLLPRITGRDQRHVVKHLPLGPAVDFLTTYRKGYARLLAEMGAESQLRVMEFDTSRVPLEAIAEEVLLVVGSGGVAGGARQRARGGAAS